MNFKIAGLAPIAFRHVFGLSDHELASHHVIRCRVDAENAFPCRITLEDAAMGDSVLLMSYEHQPVKTHINPATRYMSMKQPLTRACLSMKSPRKCNVDCCQFVPSMPKTRSLMPTWLTDRTPRH